MPATTRTTDQTAKAQIEARYSGGVTDNPTLGRIHRATVRRVETLLPRLTVANLLDVETFLQGMVDHQYCMQINMSAKHVPFIPSRRR